MYEKMYTVALRKRVDGDRFYHHQDFVFYEAKINTKGRYWIADPFLFEKDNVVYLFYEAYDLIVQRGYIGYSVVNDDGSCSEPHIIIRGGHKSFPYIFENEQGIFIMPESCEDDNIRLFKAKNFPNEWVEYKVLVPDIFGVDSILLKDDTHHYILTSEQYRYPEKNKVMSCWVKNRLFEINDEPTKNFDIVSSKVVAEGEEGTRNAGAFYYDGSILMRPGQNCKNGLYGKGLKFFKVTEIAPYKEEIIYDIDCDEMQKHVVFVNKEKALLGTHTYNASKHYEVIDLSYYNKLVQGTLLLRNIRNVLKFIYRFGKKSIWFSKKVSNKFLRFIHYNDDECYESVVNQESPWIFISYIADPFYHQNDRTYLDKHQNKREALAMAKVFNHLGYNAYFMLHTSNKPIPKKKFKLLFGHEPNIERAKEKYPDANMVFYGVSTYFDYRNNKIKEMTLAFNEVFNAHAIERRLVAPHHAIENAQQILLIGSDRTIETYPEKYREKITKIHQSTQNCRYLKYVDVVGSKDIFYLASSGNILKGLQAVIQFFTKHQEYTLHWVGPVESDVKKAIEDEITPNIVMYGFQDINSNTVLGIMERCDFMIYPSGVEGVPGSVLNAMKSGLIPLVTPWASFDGIEEYGFVMQDANEAGVESAINWAMNLPLEEIGRRKKACQKFVLENYNLEIFAKEFEDFMRNVLY